jgi:hypothetical protein
MLHKKKAIKLEIKLPLVTHFFTKEMANLVKATPC